MAFVPRTLEQILSDMIDYVQANSDISDFSVGSAARTILEAAALEDDEQYFQMAQILSAFSIFTAKGEKLDRRVADYGISRLEAKKAQGKVQFFDNNLVRDAVAIDASVGTTTLNLFDTSLFPTSGFPVTIRVGEGTIRVQDISVIANDTALGTLTLGSGLAKDAEVGDRVSLVTGAVSRSINIGQQIQAPPTTSESAKVFTTREKAFIEAGNYLSNIVLAEATTSGASSNVGLSRVTQFAGTPPFSGAGVINTTAMVGGADREKDSALVKRAVSTLPTLSRGTPVALINSLLGVEDPTTGQKILSANVIEDFNAKEVICYIDDGTGLTPDTVTYPISTIPSAVTAADPTLTLTDASEFPTAGTLYVFGSFSGSAVDELIDYESKDGNVLTLTTGGIANSYDAGAEAQFVDVVETSTETGQTRFRLQNFPIVRSAEVLYKKEPTDTTFQTLTRDTDYKLNKGTGDVILTSALAKGSQLIAAYTYYTGLVARAQKVIDGDPSDPITFPGVRAAGIFVVVEAPTIKRVTIKLSISAEKGFSEADLIESVRSNVEEYVSSLGIGDDVVRSKIIEAAHDVTGVRSVVVLSPTASVLTVLENELPVPFDSSGNSLVTIV